MKLVLMALFTTTVSIDCYAKASMSLQMRSGALIDPDYASERYGFKDALTFGA